MPIVYSNTKELSQDQLQSLFLSVQWSSGNYPDKLRTAMSNSDNVLTAWDGDTLVGLMNALSDGAMTAYFHYLLVRPEYQGQGIGTKLVLAMLDLYEAYARKVLIAYDKEIRFYQKLGFTLGHDKSPMFVTCLTT